MKIKTNPDLNLLNGKKRICRCCQEPLAVKTHTFYMKHAGTDKKKLVEEIVLYCTRCHRKYLTQEMCNAITRKHPKYYIDLALYTIKASKKKNLPTPDNTSAGISSPSFKVPPSEDDQIQANHLKGTSTTARHLGFSVPIHLSNTYGIHHQTCPKCCSVLNYEKVNIPVLLMDGSFHRYYSDRVLLCNNCKCGYIDKKTADAILKRIQKNSVRNKIIGLANVEIKYSEYDNSYLYLPTLTNSTSVYFPDNDWTPKKCGESSNHLNLNSESFLRKMGYTTNRRDDERKKILLIAAQTYGKRKVIDHLSFLIETRLNQADGARKYANAIGIWQKDKNYVSSLILDST